EERPSRGVVLYTPRLGRSTRTTGGQELVLERADDGPWLPLTIGTTVRGRVREIRHAGNTPLHRDIMILSIGSGLTNSVHVQTGSTVTLSFDTVPSLVGARMALSGGWVLVREGRVQELQIPDSGSYKYRNVVERHPRSAIGSDRNHLYLVQVDGRQKGLSVGMTLAELAEYMRGLGCEQALSLDGGASATIWFNGRVVNSPSSGFDREIANGLVVLQKTASPP
ncbi:MAG TPA: phosphodiester glycosidase family protein, partial [Methylomirabilota bacterium]|nr:phosphodiester glycosidase family protein [Methylomirabilota bacterium]